MSTKTEESEQIAVVEWCELYRIPVVHIPNEGKRSQAYGLKLRRLGMRRGFPDLFVPEARGGFYGLFVEMKKDQKSRVREEQRKWIDYLSRMGYKALVCYGADDAIKTIKDYYLSV